MHLTRRALLVAIPVIAILIAPQATASAASADQGSTGARSSTIDVASAAETDLSAYSSVVSWGVSSTGEKWYSVAKSDGAVEAPAGATEVSPSEARALFAAADTAVGSREAVAAAAPPAACSIYVGYLNVGFNFSSDMICSGYYGAIEMEANMARSAWYGWASYGGTLLYPPSSAPLYYGPTLSVNWYWRCNTGAGLYDYYGVSRGYSSTIGWGPNTRTGNVLLQKNCGSNP